MTLFGKRIPQLYLILFLVLLLSVPLFLFKLENRMTDFRVFYQAGERFLHSEQLYRFSDGHYQFKYPPVFAMFYSPISLLPVKIAGYAWTLILLFSVYFLVTLSLKINRVSSNKERRILAFFTILVMAKFYGHELDLGQVNLVMAVVLAMMMIFYLKDQWIIGSLFLAISVIIKPYALIFLPYLILKKQFRALGALLIFLVFFNVLPIVKYGYGDWWNVMTMWYQTLASSTPRLFSNIDNVSLIGFLAKWVDSPSHPHLIFSLWMGIASILAVLFLISQSGKPRNNRLAETVEHGFLLTMIPLLAPLGWDYTFLIATPAIVTIMAARMQFPRLLRILILLDLAVIAFSLYDLMGRNLYHHFMEWSILTPCYLIISGALLFLRFNLKDDSESLRTSEQE